MVQNPPPVFTPAMITALAGAIALGAKEVDYGDKKVVYQDLGAMISLLNLMQTQVYGTPTMADRRKQGIFNSTIYCNRGGEFGW